MEFLSIAKQRFSVRSYTSQHVEPEKLEKILEAARVAPTAANLQPIRLIVAQSEQSLAKIGKAANIYGAPLAIIVCADHEKAWVRPFDKKQTGDIDASILTDHMMLQATELGLEAFGYAILIRTFCAGSLNCRNILNQSIFWQLDIPMPELLIPAALTGRELP